MNLTDIKPINDELIKHKNKPQSKLQQFIEDKNLNDDNKKKFADMVHKSPEHLQKAADFAFKHAK